MIKNLIILSLFLISMVSVAVTDLNSALRRSFYLFSGRLPSGEELQQFSASVGDYQNAIRNLIDSDPFYDAILRYHQRLFGVGLPVEYIDELLKEDIDGKRKKFARINCSRDKDNRFICQWSSVADSKGRESCPKAWEEEASVFWYPGVIAWVCPSILQACGTDLSRCFIEYHDNQAAEYSELGVTDFFDSRHAVIHSLSRQSAGLAASIVVNNYPYSKILDGKLTALDGAIAHFYSQSHHFRLEDLRIPGEIMGMVSQLSPTNPRFTLIGLESSAPYSAGILTTFGWLRRYDKNRTRANELYERLLCRQFTSELPRVFPQDPGNLREVEGCSGCHATLDPLADFFLVWGEGGEIYNYNEASVETFFNGKSGSSVSDLAAIIQSDPAFFTCTVQNVWEWLMGRKFYRSESDLRLALTNYFVATKESFKELVFAIATHPAFMDQKRGDGVVSDPLEAPPLGQFPQPTERTCDQVYTFSDDILNLIHQCTNCHASGTDRVDLTTEGQWRVWGSQAVDMMSSGQMPPGQFGQDVIDLRDRVRCWLSQ